MRGARRQLRADNVQKSFERVVRGTPCRRAKPQERIVVWSQAIRQGWLGEYPKAEAGWVNNSTVMLTAEGSAPNPNRALLG
jgi:hypothetical protein